MKPGTKLVCTANEIWYVGSGPAYNEVVTFNSVSYVDCDYITLKEYGDDCAYHNKYFAPLGDISELTSILESEPITESV